MTATVLARAERNARRALRPVSNPPPRPPAVTTRARVARVAG
ncbi:MAG: hypothetical protein QOD57_2329, partial [Actinomycetota bacterium]|nr:hypothetical protein [Actinomycetota bacterium]